MEKWLWGYVGAVFLTGTIVTVQSMWDLSKSDWAWAQAVAAVAGAFMVRY